jgi:hypothetical protein
VSVRHPTNRDRSNVTVIQSKGAVKLCVGDKRAQIFILGANGSWLEEGMLSLGTYR